MGLRPFCDLLLQVDRTWAEKFVQMKNELATAGSFVVSKRSNQDPDVLLSNCLSTHWYDFLKYLENKFRERIFKSHF